MTTEFFKPVTSRHAGHLRFKFWSAPRSKAERGLVILQGGRSEYFEKYTEVAEELMERDFSVVSLDWRGQGGSARPLSDPHKGHIDTFRTYINDFHGFLRELGKTYDPKSTIFMAHSMGGNIMTRYAQRYPDAAAGLVLSAPMFSYRVGPIPWQSVSLMANALGATASEQYAPTQGKWHWRRPESFFRLQKVTRSRERFNRNMNHWKQDPTLALGGVTNGWLSEAAQSCFELLEPNALAQLRLPVLLLSGRDDVVVGLKEHKAAVEHMPDVNHLVIHNARHEILMEVDQVRAAFWRAFDENTERFGL